LAAPLPEVRVSSNKHRLALDDKTLVTFVTEVEKIRKNRPITRVSNDINQSLNAESYFAVTRQP
jgi:hypothetical protein